MMQFWTYFWRFRQCQLNFIPFASALHPAVAFSKTTLSALDIFAACHASIAAPKKKATPAAGDGFCLPVIGRVTLRLASGHFPMQTVRRSLSG
jgi:hypothetical protein